MFFGQYTRTKSFFSNSDLAAKGLPTGLELKILKKYENKIPKSIFTTPYEPPVTDSLGWPRNNLTTAKELLQDAGWNVEDMILTNSDSGELFTFEILLYSEGFERIVLPFARNLKKLGVDVRVRRVDQTQYINRVRNFDYDMIVSGWGSSESPGNEQFGHWSSTAADSPAASNYAGVRANQRACSSEIKRGSRCSHQSSRSIATLRVLRNTSMASNLTKNPLLG